MMKDRILKFGTVFCAGVLTLAFAVAGYAADKETSGDPYPLATCPVTGKALDSMGDPVVKVYDGREVRFCCAGCPAKFEADQEKYTAQIDAAIADQQREFYPLDTCVVSGEPLTSMGEPVERVYNNRLVRFCCAGCVDKFEADSEAYLGKIDAAVIEAQKKDYPLDFCVVSGDELGGDMGDPVDVVQGNRLYRVCCKGCIKSLHENPLKYQTMLDDALAGKDVARPEGSDSKPGHDDDHGHGKHK